MGDDLSKRELEFNRIVILESGDDVDEAVRKLNADGYRITSITIDRMPPFYVPVTESHRGMMQKGSITVYLLAERTI